MATTTVGNGQSVNNQDVTSGNTLDVQSGGMATTTTVENGGILEVDPGGAETGATIRAGGTETIAGTINSSNAVTTSGTASGDDDFGTINVASGGSISNVTVENGATLNLTAKSAYATGVTVNAGGALTINGNAPANNVTLQGGLFELESPKADTTNATSGVPTASGTLTFASGATSRLQLDVGQTGSNATTFSQTITGFAAGDVINLKSITGGSLSTTSANGNTTVTVSGTGGSESFTFVNTPGTFATTTDANGGTDLVVACFCAGTLIRAVRGGRVADIAVEDLAVGDEVVTSSGARRAITWLGHRTIDCRRHPRRGEAYPIRIVANAFGRAKPVRDLYVSPGHAICIDAMGEVLIPAGALVDGSSVRQVEVDRVTYWHVELASHDVILAENLPAESYLDVGNRCLFSEADLVSLAASPDAPRLGQSDVCRPFHADGPIVDAVRARLATGSVTSRRAAA